MPEAKRILVVEDEPQIRELIQARLESAGYTTLTAENGQEGLEQVKKVCPDLIITDVLMPVMDGFTFYKELKKTMTTARIPVLIVTARGKMEDTFKIVGADDFITKPFESQELVEKAGCLVNRIKAETIEDTGKDVPPVAADQETTGNTEKAVKFRNIELLSGVALLAVILVIAIFLFAKMLVSG